MTFIIIIVAFLSLTAIIILHEFGHFILAKKFGVRVEEFGIGFPPRLIGKKIGGTLYSLNLLPFGAFVKIYGEEGDGEGPESFSQKPIWQRALIVLGGVLVFWIIAVVLLSIVMGLGARIAVDDAANGNLKNPKVQIVAVSSNSPAELSGLRAGDAIKNFLISDLNFPIYKIKELQELTEEYRGQNITLTIERGKEVFGVSFVPRVNPPQDEGPIGVSLVRTATKSYPWYSAPFQGIISTVNLTAAVILGWGQALINVFYGRPTGVQLMGPVGIFSLFAQIGQLGVIYFLQFIALISIYLAVFNILPIPMVDGGRLLFLAIEGIRKKPIPQRIEQGINSVFFVLLVTLMIWITIKDVIRLF